VAKTQEISQI